jgi:phosphoglycerate dehydrogenase-like enzyme
MGRKVRIGLTRDLFDKNGKFILPCPGPKWLEEMPNVEYETLPEFSREVKAEQIADFDMVISLYPRWTEQTLASNNRLLAVMREGVGYDMIDVPALTNAGVLLCITPSGVRRPMATAIIALVLALSLRLLDKVKLVRDGRWAEKAKYHGMGLVGKTLGSIGAGNIGHEMFALAKPFGMKHIAYDPYVTQEAVADVDVKLVDMDTVLTESDFLNISCPLNKETRHLVGEKELRKMKKTAFLINTARGATVDEVALIKALQYRWIQGAGLDVFEEEPIQPDNPLVKMDNVIVTPHSLGWTDQNFIGEWNSIIKQISQIIHGELPENPVNPEVWEKSEFQSKLKKFHKAIK